MKKFQIENRMYNNIMRAVAKHAAHNEDKPILQGVYFEVESGKVRITALDGYRMIHYVVPLTVAELEPANFVMPIMPMASHKKEQSYIEIDYSDVGGDFGRIHVTDVVDDVTVSRRVYKGDYVNYQNVIAFGHEKPVSIAVNVRYLIDALSAAVATCDKYEKEVAMITFDANNNIKPLVVTRRGMYGDATHLVLPVKAPNDEFCGEI
jgi:DNA polymerase III sliding clamp (beta) subunit (PCNA family)